jgi:hypothetical protein
LLAPFFMDGGVGSSGGGGNVDVGSVGGSSSVGGGSSGDGGEGGEGGGGGGGGVVLEKCAPERLSQSWVLTEGGAKDALVTKATFA